MTLQLILIMFIGGLQTNFATFDITGWIYINFA